MALSPFDIALLRQHLARFPASQNCPVCGVNNWNVNGPFAFMPVTPTGDLALGGETVPLVILVCMNCFYTRPFAWKAIQLSQVAHGPRTGIGGSQVPTVPGGVTGGFVKPVGSALPGLAPVGGGKPTYWINPGTKK